MIDAGQTEYPDVGVLLLNALHHLQRGRTTHRLERVAQVIERAQVRKDLDVTEFSTGGEAAVDEVELIDQAFQVRLGQR